MKPRRKKLVAWAARYGTAGLWTGIYTTRKAAIELGEGPPVKLVEHDVKRERLIKAFVEAASSPGKWVEASRAINALVAYEKGIE
jgi:hypothetical protein